MKTAALAFSVILGLASVAWATQPLQQEVQEEFLLTMPLTAVCLDSSVAAQSLSKDHGEIPFAQGPGLIWNNMIEDYIEVLIKIYLNPSTFSFTIAYEVPFENITCVVTTGNDFQPFRNGPRT